MHLELHIITTVTNDYMYYIQYFMRQSRYVIAFPDEARWFCCAHYITAEQLLAATICIIATLICHCAVLILSAPSVLPLQNVFPVLICIVGTTTISGQFQHRGICVTMLTAWTLISEGLTNPAVSCYRKIGEQNI